MGDTFENDIVTVLFVVLLWQFVGKEKENVILEKHGAGIYMKSDRFKSYSSTISICLLKSGLLWKLTETSIDKKVQWTLGTFHQNHMLGTDYSPVVRNPPSSAGLVGLTPGGGTKIPHVMHLIYMSMAWWNSEGQGEKPTDNYFITCRHLSVFEWNWPFPKDPWSSGQTQLYFCFSFMIWFFPTSPHHKLK